MRCALAALVAIAGLLTTAAAAPTAPVRTTSGLVVGTTVEGLATFKGIPFAAAPVGALRWRAPQPAARWTGVRTADRYGPGCWQPAQPPAQAIFGNPEGIDEDCLTLNVVRHARGRGLRPVIVWIHGGGLINGVSSLAAYDGSAFARGGLVFVSFNYRLGRLGIYAHSALARESAGYAALGNYALLDQIAALQWVRSNIRAFGGDPGNVTVFGESAGAYSILALMTSPRARGLFHKAIVQSGYGRGYYRRIYRTAPDGQESAESEGLALARQWGAGTAGDAAQLRAIPIETIMRPTGSPQGTLAFYLDGDVLADDLWSAFRAGREMRIPLLIGSNSQESPAGAWDIPAIRRFIEPRDDAPLESAYGGAEQLRAHLRGDFVFGEPARALARLHASHGNPTYVYVFGAVTAEQARAGEGARHAAEIRYVFDTLEADPRPAAALPAPHLAPLLNESWRRFATDGDPSRPTGPRWPRYDGERIMEITSDGFALRADPRKRRLDALAKIVDPKS